MKYTESFLHNKDLLSRGKDLQSLSPTMGREYSQRKDEKIFILRIEMGIEIIKFNTYYKASESQI